MAWADFFPSPATLKEQALAFAANRARQWAHNDTSYLGKTLRAMVVALEGWHATSKQVAYDSVPSSDTSHEGLGKWLNILGLSTGTGTPGKYGFRDPIAAKGATAQASGAGSSVIPALAELVGPDGVTRYRVRSSVTLPAVVGTAQATVILDAITPGAVGNLDAGARLSWSPAPAGIDPDVVLLAGFGGTGRDGESDAEAYVRVAKKMQLPPKGGAPQDYGHGAEAWPENAVDRNGNPIDGLRVYGYSRNGGYDGTGSPMGVLTLVGTGRARRPSADILTDVSAYVRGTTGQEGQAPIAHDIRYIAPFMPAERGLIVQARVLPSKDLYKPDWVSAGESDTALFVDAYDPGPPAKITVVALGPRSLKLAIDKKLQPRLYIDTRDGIVNFAPTGPIIPVQARVTAWQDVAGQTVFTLQDPLPPGWQVPCALAIERIRPGGPVVAPVASSMLAKLNELGPARGDFADENDIWQDVASINNLVTSCENTVDGDGITPLLTRVLTGGLTIQVGGNGSPAAADVAASDNTVNGPELLYPTRILVID